MTERMGEGVRAGGPGTGTSYPAGSTYAGKLHLASASELVFLAWLPNPAGRRVPRGAQQPASGDVGSRREPAASMTDRLDSQQHVELRLS